MDSSGMAAPTNSDVANTSLSYLCLKNSDEKIYFITVIHVIVTLSWLTRHPSGQLMPKLLVIH
jgi:hypothetical protein